jgi:hypothetical protein
MFGPPRRWILGDNYLDRIQLQKNALRGIFHFGNGRMIQCGKNVFKVLISIKGCSRNSIKNLPDNVYHEFWPKYTKVPLILRRNQVSHHALGAFIVKFCSLLVKQPQPTPFSLNFFSSCGLWMFPPHCWIFSFLAHSGYTKFHHWPPSEQVSIEPWFPVITVKQISTKLPLNIESHVRWALVTTAWHVFRLWMEGSPTGTEGSCKYIE